MYTHTHTPHTHIHTTARHFIVKVQSIEINLKYKSPTHNQKEKQVTYRLFNGKTIKARRWGEVSSKKVEKK
jgi:hypothetical protein